MSERQESNKGSRAGVSGGAGAFPCKCLRCGCRGRQPPAQVFHSCFHVVEVFNIRGYFLLVVLNGSLIVIVIVFSCSSNGF